MGGGTDVDRLEANRAILAALAAEVESHPELRFHQLLADLGVEEPGKDKFYEESEKTLEGLRRTSAGASHNRGMSGKQEKCCLCGRGYEGYGSSAAPLDEGRCCDECNAAKVVPARTGALGEKPAP